MDSKNTIVFFVIILKRNWIRRIRKAVEGEEEGLYRVGSKAIYQHKADSLKEIGMSEYASQENIDYAYLGLLAAKDVFEDSKNPFVSSLKELIDECHFTLENTVEGTLPGQFKPGAKDSLEISVGLAEAILEMPGLTQRIIDRECETLIHALCDEYWRIFSSGLAETERTFPFWMYLYCEFQGQNKL